MDTFMEDFFVEEASKEIVELSLFPEVDARGALEQGDIAVVRSILTSITNKERDEFVRTKLSECWSQETPIQKMMESIVLDLAVEFEIIGISDCLYTLEFEPQGIYKTYDPHHLLPDRDVLVVWFEGKWRLFTKQFALWFLKNVTSAALPRFKDTPFGRFVA